MCSPVTIHCDHSLICVEPCVPVCLQQTWVSSWSLIVGKTDGRPSRGPCFALRWVCFCATLTLCLRCVCFKRHFDLWEEEMCESRERCWERPGLSLSHSSTTDITTALGGGLAYMSAPYAWTLSHHCLPCLLCSLAKNDRSRWYFVFIHLNGKNKLRSWVYLING